MLRGFLLGLTMASLMVLSGCSGSSQLPSVPPAPPPGTVKDAPPVTESTSKVIKGRRGRVRPAPTSPTAS
jgi:hypothetical protein